MAVALPALPKESTVKERYIGFSATLTPAIGGSSQEVQRLGSRFGLDVTLPTLAYDDARAWTAARLKAKNLGQTLTLVWPQKAFAGGVGAPVANGAGQTGSALAVRGLNAGAAIPALSFFSYAANGRHYLCAVTDAAVADGAGHATLQIAPMLRFPPADGAVLEFAAPVLEGLLDGANVEWDLLRLQLVGASFTLAENE